MDRRSCLSATSAGEMWHQMARPNARTAAWMLLVLFVSRLTTVTDAYDFYSSQSETTWTTATVSITYRDPSTGNLTTETQTDAGRFSSGSPRDARGVLVHGRGTNSQGCVPYRQGKQPVAVPVKRLDHQGQASPWIALVRRGNCTDSEKIKVAEKYNASGVVVYDNKPGNELYTIPNSCNIPAILISAENGQRIATLVENGTSVQLEFGVGNTIIKSVQFKKSSVLFVSVAFIVLMIISLAWLVFYYIQRFRYAQARDRSQKRLSRAAKKAIGKLPAKHLREGDEELASGEMCPVCLEGYKVSDLIRVLPCNHFYHKCCVDQWLIEHRTCPMCKLNILKVLGYGNQLTMRASEEALYVFELGQIIFNSNIDGEDAAISAATAVRTSSLRTSHLTRWPSATQQSVRVVAVTEDAQSEGSRSDESRNGSSSSEGILPPVTTTVELHRNCPSPAASDTPCLGSTCV